MRGMCCLMVAIEMLEEYQQLLNKIPGIISSKIIIGEDKNITEIHVLSDISRGPKQIVRDIQSALLAKFDLSIDHKVISIAQVEDSGLTIRDFRLIIGHIKISSEQGKVEASVVLTEEGQMFEGTATGGNSTQGRFRVIAEATLEAIHKFLNKNYIFVLSDAIKINLADREAIAVSVFHFTDYGEECLSGSSVIKYDDNEAVVKATLDAVNRRLFQYYMK